MAQEDKRSMNADALASLASGGPAPLAEQDAPQTPPAEAGDAPAAPADPDDPFAALLSAPAPAASDPQAVVPAIPDLAGSASLSPAAKKARAAQLQRKAQQQHGHHFRQVAIPLLLVVGAILFVMATVVLVNLPEEPSEYPMSLMESPFAPWLVVAAYLVGAVLFLGAFLFHIEVRQAKLKAKRAENRAAQEAQAGQ